MELLRIKEFLIGEGNLLSGRNTFLSSPLSVKPSTELGRPFRKLAIYHVSLLVFVI